MAENDTAPRMPGKVFVLGDSRTGTTTLHKFLRRAGYNSLHYFFKESGVPQPAHVNFEANAQTLKTFIDTTDYNAFSDYPLRSFYKMLFAEYPDQYFILTTRKSVETWQKSMLAFFGKFDIDINIEALTGFYLTINQEIRDLAAETGARFCEICIDDDADQNGHALSEFLGLEEMLSLGWENSTKSYDNRMWSSRVTFYNTTEEDVLGYVKKLTEPAKAMLSEYGWTYLINDSSDFLDYCYGGREWPAAVLDKACATLQTRHTDLAARGIAYLKFAIPEKPVIYPQFLPKVFAGKPPSKQRPAKQIARKNPPGFSYLDDVLRDARSFGMVYFRGDSHANWLGAYFIYYHMIQQMNAALKGGQAQIKRAFKLADLTPSLAAYGGDLYTQLDPEARGAYDGAWREVSLGDKAEYLVRYALPEADRRAVPQEVAPEYLAALGDRETFRFSHPNKNLPRAVIFRDSTADYLVDLLAEHFSESLFIWHKGRVYDDVIAREKPDVVLHVMAERFLLQYQHTAPFNQLLDAEKG
ncbi:MAG: sulfotransferase [Alterinioella nitratireducens]|uniref:sulfotransferase n=1 Tax=Alterinioella nitratireducens TaxID=2735915 RepID=UPI0040591147